MWFPVITGVLLISFGFFNFIFGFDTFSKAAKEAYTGKEKPEPKAKAGPKSEAQQNAEKARDLQRAMESCKSLASYEKDAGAEQTLSQTFSPTLTQTTTADCMAGDMLLVKANDISQSMSLLHY